MCLSLSKIHPGLPIVAIQDIRVYKLGWIIKEQFVPMWKTEFRYTKDEITAKVQLKITSSGCDSYPGYITEGYHSYNDLRNAQLDFFKQVAKSRGIRMVAGIFSIPKSTQYYQSGHEIVSEQIIYKGII